MAGPLLAIPAVVEGAGWAYGAYRAWRLAQAARAAAQAMRAARAAEAAKAAADALSKADKKECKEGCDPDCDKMQHGNGGNALLNDLCKMACECQKDRGGAATNQKCVENKLRNSRYGQPGSRSPSNDGAHPEVSHRPNADGGYDPVMSRSRPTEFSNAPVVSGAPRPDISVYQGGKLSKIIEMKFPNDTFTQMQQAGRYEAIARANGLDPNKDVININVEKDCSVPQS